MTTLYDPTREQLAESLQGEPRYRLDQPLPMQVLAVIRRMTVNDG